ncbi:unnamed protein product [Dibothriocephalus latus]|uniref:Uncharacterized protein n=1 Tax=Dibothriocephalus latus TaxID=60516 RepID=A0A3P7L9H1_DIBLA|nr:unnamed protein product [Dibothriocephalus latus]
MVPACFSTPLCYGFADSNAPIYGISFPSIIKNGNVKMEITVVPQNIPIHEVEPPAQSTSARVDEEKEDHEFDVDLSFSEMMKYIRKYFSFEQMAVLNTIWGEFLLLFDLVMDITVTVKFFKRVGVSPSIFFQEKTSRVLATSKTIEHVF